MTGIEDCCAVCAEPLEWVAYGLCNHREVCSTCIVRLRFVLKDNKCCICKQECPAVFVTKALGDYTKQAGDFSKLSTRLVRKGEGDLWYDPAVEAYFDDKDHFKTIQAMNRLSCVMCDKMDQQQPLSLSRGFVPRGFTFGSLGALKKHYDLAHKLSMCSLCLEGRKVFVSEQKLYPPAQLERHSASGDSVVDGTDEERGGFKGHPLCQFCQKRFYGDNELYQHMTQEHYTCFLCQRARPGSYDFFHNYNDLETHFRGEHFLCEDQGCLERKFVVFSSEQDLKRHNAQHHGGNMSRAERNRALQIPATQLFDFSRRPTQEGNSADNSSHRRIPRGRQPGEPGVLVVPQSERMNATMRASIESAALENAMRESVALAESTEAQRVRANRLEAERWRRQNGTANSDRPSAVPLTEAFPTLPGQDGQQLSAAPSGQYLNNRQPGSTSLIEEYFPPLPVTSRNAKKRANPKGVTSRTSMASLLGGGQSLAAVGNTSLRLQPGPSSGISLGGGSGAAKPWSGVAGPSSRPVQNLPHVSSSPLLGSPAGGGGPLPGRDVTGNSSSSAGVTNGIAAGLSMEELKSANKALIEKIREGLGGNEQQFADFKDASGRFRRGDLSSTSYYLEIARLGLSYVVPELARLCPDPQKREELLAAHAQGILTNEPPKSAAAAHPGGSSALGGSVGPSRTVAAQPPRDRSAVRKGKVAMDSVASSSARARGSVLDVNELSNMSSDGFRRIRIGKGAVLGNESRLLTPLGASSSSSIHESASAPDLLAQQFQGLSVAPVSGQRITNAGGPMNDDVWTCPVCTLNNTGNDWCAACESGRPGTGLLRASEDSGSLRSRERRRKR